MNARQTAIGLLFSAAGIATLCAMDAMVKALGANLSTFEIALVRYAGSAAWLAIFLLLTRGAWPERRNFGRHAARGALVMVTACLFFYGITNLPLAIAAALGMAAPIYVSIFSVIFLKERLSPVIGLAIALGIVGSLVIIFGGEPIDTTNASNLLAWAAAALAPACYALVIIMLKHHSSDESAAAMTLAQSFIAALIALPLALPGMVMPPVGLWPQIVLVGFLGALGFLLIIAGLRRVPASVFAVVDYTGLLWAAFYGYLFFAETPELRLWIGGGLIIGACAVGMRATQR